MALTSDELTRLENLESGVAENFLRDARAEGYSIYDMKDGFGDTFANENGVDTATSTNETYDASGDFYTNSGLNMSLVSESESVSGAFTPPSTAPTNARMVILHKPVDSVTLNTDAVLSVSRDGGTTFTAFTLTKVADHTDGRETLTTEDMDISGQPSGTDMIWKFETFNSKEQQLHDVTLQWR